MLSYLRGGLKEETCTSEVKKAKPRPSLFYVTTHFTDFYNTTLMKILFWNTLHLVNSHRGAASRTQTLHLSGKWIVKFYNRRLLKTKTFWSKLCPLKYTCAHALHWPAWSWGMKHPSPSRYWAWEGGRWFILGGLEGVGAQMFLQTTPADELIHHQEEQLNSRY